MMLCEQSPDRDRTRRDCTLTAACVTDPGDRRAPRSRKAAIGGVGGAVGGYLLGDLVGGRRDRTEKIVGAGIGGLAGAGIGAYMDRQERELRARTAGTDVQVIRAGRRSGAQHARRASPSPTTAIEHPAAVPRDAGSGRRRCCAI